MDNDNIRKVSINTIRTLAMDAVQKAGSGHPGTAMSLAPAAYVLWNNIMKYNPKNPHWFNRDRFVLSNGHASIIQYIMLHLTGYHVSMEDLKNLRQWGSKTPGHPEYGLTEGIETTTGPLGQGFMTAVGMTMAEAHLASRFNKPDFPVVDHYVYGFCSDGDLMEGASSEAASLAGHFGLGKLIFLYDDNHISIDGDTEITYSDDIKKRFEGYNWHVQDLGESANDIEKITKAYEAAQQEKDRPSLIILRTHIAHGAPNKQDTAAAHGSALGEDEVKATKRVYGMPEDKTFYVPEEVKRHMEQAIERGEQLEKEWNAMYERYEQKHPDWHALLEKGKALEPDKDWDKDIPEFKPDDGPVATRKASAKIINSFAQHVPYLLGGSADLAASTKTLMEDWGYFGKGNYQNRNIPWGIREHGMAAATSGITLHGGLRAFAATFFIFSDYARPAIRLAALMKLPTIYVLTHDSIGLGGDGPTHQPVEHLASFRAMPNIFVFRPADANEVAYTWRAVLRRKKGPSMMVLTRQNVPVADRSKYASADGVLKGAYVLSKEKGDAPDAILMGTGSEVSIALEAQEKLRDMNVDARVVSMPCWELFREQDENYRNEVLPQKVKARTAVEAGAALGWKEWVGDDGTVVSVDRFGSSAPYQENFAHYGFTVDNVVEHLKKSIAQSQS
ncbi:transketolase [Prolixibacter denitrificans]|uniref:Transketolase n=1 Tax=Prolixibacter denitrificans TaxID=1541063 RepID=A0A2P8CFS7_9BACT|nr:transketolase [Prolixibacter denitrificans]PSK83772.1 transketolase [Prolixibacter denitrificans]GET23315.1 transketolase [Prolixibacter denitrificans]